MERLKQRLKMVNVTSQSVCNCHGDSQLLEVIFIAQEFLNFPSSNKCIFADPGDAAEWLHLHRQTPV